jgi:formylglycine-generating enzyme required for sulfatase activity/dienelactone hydrolase
MRLSPGTRLRRYEIRTLIGEGGMGQVYVARDVELERNVAIKVLPSEVSGMADRLLRFSQEAKLTSALNHPNVAHVYEIGHEEGVHFIAMELVEGETLRERLGARTLSVSDTLELATQIASALAAAHAAGIVHRDIKPENVMIRPDGYVKVLDFGLAKLREFRGEEGATAVKTGPGMTMGTVDYMSPEQLEGGDIDARTDIFSLGVMLYEMLGGRRPFTGENTAAVMTSIMTREAPPISTVRNDVPQPVQSLLEKALAKKPQERFTSAGEMAAALKQAHTEAQVEAIRSEEVRRISGEVGTRVPVRRIGMIVGALIAVLAVVAAGTLVARQRRTRTAMGSLENAEKLLARHSYAEAFAAASAAGKVLAGEERVSSVIAASSDELSVTTSPPGARVFLQRFGDPAGRVLSGTTPVEKLRIPRGEYILSIEKEGYATVRLPLSTTPIRWNDVQVDQPPPPIRLTLRKSSEVPAGMVFVAGGEQQLGGWSRPSDRIVDLADFYIDEREVSNRDFQQFVREGGYRRRELWKHPFTDGEKTFSFEEGVARFRDSTGVPGPRGWAGGEPQAGKEDDPVTGVSWYEAAAYAEWKGKRLPSVYQWERAARPNKTSPFTSTLPWGLVSQGTDVAERANFSGKGVMPVTSMPFGLSPFGALHMAGNVTEWCRNPRPPGFTTRGGSWNDPVYNFGETGSYPPFYSDTSIGFRCVKETRADNQGDFGLSVAGYAPRYTAVDDAAFEEIRARYNYTRGNLNAEIIERKELPDWVREKIRFPAANGQTALAYLYLPRGYSPPYQIIHFIPAGDVDSGLRPATAAIEGRFVSLIRGGRAVFTVIIEGYQERPRDGELPPQQSPEYVDYLVSRVTDLRRGLDYIGTRKDIDSTRIGLIGPSAGSATGIVTAALDRRYRSVMFIGAGVRATDTGRQPAANRINFVPRISAPALLFQGKYDETVSLKSESEPLFALLKEPKRMELYEGGHAPHLEIAIPAMQKWLDETLGPVR